MDDDALHKLAHKHRPVVFLHPNERYMPLDFNRYIDAAQLKDTRNGLTVGAREAFSSEIFGQWLKDKPEVDTPDFTLFLPQGMETPIIKDYHPTEDELKQVPLYVHSRQTPKSAQGNFHVYVSYSFLYAYNGPESVCGFKIGAHYADIEHVTTELSVSRRGDVTFNQLYTSRHNGGVWTPAPELKWLSGDRPTVFSSLNGHASYTAPGNYKRFWGVAVDRCDYGPRWDTDTLIFLSDKVDQTPPLLRWTHFRGSLGDGHVDCFANKSYINDNEVNEEYGSSCSPWKWRL